MNIAEVKDIQREQELIKRIDIEIQNGVFSQLVYSDGCGVNIITMLNGEYLTCIYAEQYGITEIK
jgi:hypothetical protein